MNNQLSRQFKISNEAVPKVMGQSGATIKRIQEESGARLIFQGQNNTIYENGRILIIKALDADKLEVARQMVEEFCGPSNIHLVEEEPVFLDLQSFTNQASSPSPSLNSEALGGSVCSQILVEDQFQIPSGIVAFVVGRDQGNLKQLQIHKKQLKVLEEQQIYFKKRTLLVEKQIQQLDMDNYVKRSQLQLPASLTIEYNGHTYELSNQIDPQATDKEDLRKLEKEKKMP